jgi:hypothetical protein
MSPWTPGRLRSDNSNMMAWLASLVFRLNLVDCYIDLTGLLLGSGDTRYFCRVQTQLDGLFFAMKGTCASQI